MRILMIDDDHDLADLAKAALSAEGFAVDIFNTLEDGCLAIETMDYDAIILDLILPDGDGLSLLEARRQQGDLTPVLILSTRSKIDDRVKGLESGGDDYLPKPFAPQELIARVRAITRRLDAPASGTVSIANLSINPSTHEILVNETAIQLSKREWELLKILTQNLGKVTSRGYIQDQIYEFTDNPDANALEAIVSRLRKNFKESGAKVAIHTHRGEGYRLSPINDENSVS